MSYRKDGYLLPDRGSPFSLPQDYFKRAQIVSFSNSASVKLLNV